MNQWKDKDWSHLFGWNIGWYVLDSDASKTVWGIKWYECFQETIPEKPKQAIKVWDRRKTYKFHNRNKLKLLYTTTLQCVIVGTEVIIVNVEVDLVHS